MYNRHLIGRFFLFFNKTKLHKMSQKDRTLSKWNPPNTSRSDRITNAHGTKVYSKQNGRVLNDIFCVFSNFCPNLRHTNYNTIECRSLHHFHSRTDIFNVKRRIIFMIVEYFRPRLSVWWFSMSMNCFLLFHYILT